MPQTDTDVERWNRSCSFSSCVIINNLKCKLDKLIMKGYGNFLILFVIFTVVYGRRVANPCQNQGRDEIPCDNGECIYRYDWCGYGAQCYDGSDEKYCQLPLTTGCSDKHFNCGDGKCIPISLRCDGTNDCFYDTDEENCEEVDDDHNIPRKREPEPLYTTTTHFPFTNNYGVHIDRPYATSRDNDFRPLTSPSPPIVDYNNNHNTRYSGQRYDNRNPNAHPGNQQPLYTAESTPMQRRQSQPTPQSRPDYRHYDRQSPIIHPPRTIVYPPRIMSPSPIHHTVRRPNYPHFYFTKNYTEDLRYNYKRNVQDAKDWLLGKRDDSYLWGKDGRDTPRALIALSLLSNSFKSDVDDNELMRKRFESHLGLKLLRNETGRETVSTTRLAVYINTLFATCQNPHNFFGIDLVQILLQRHNHLEKNQQFVNPLVFLTLCLANINIPTFYLQPFLKSSFPTEPSKDLHILAMTAMACIAQQNPYDTRIRAELEEAVENLLNQMNSVNGSFGSKYTTALAAQALMSVNTSHNWNYKKTLDYLVREQLSDGSFGDMQLTYYTMLALSGRSLLHLRNTDCDPVGDDKKEWSPEDILNRDGPRKSISYTLRVDYPETFSTGVQLSVPIDTNFFEIMQVAAYFNSRFKFNYEYSSNEYQLGVHTIANIPNDPERGMFWTLYLLRPSSAFDFRSKYKGDIGTLIPENGDELVFWYLSDFLSY